MGIWCERVLRRFARWVGLVDILEVVLLALVCGLAINGTSVSAVWTAILGTSYLIFLVLKWYLMIDSRRATDRIQGEVMWGLFDLFNKQLFGDDCYVRITLFRPDPLSSKFIVPWYRYERGGKDSIADAQRSHARYAKGEGRTGVAWEQAGDNTFSFALLGPFENRQQFEKRYTQELGISAKVTKRLSTYMEDTGVIISGGFCDTRGKFLGVVSIDLQWTAQPFDEQDEVSVEEIKFFTKDEKQRTLDSNKFVTVAILVQSVLRSFTQVSSR